MVYVGVDRPSLQNSSVVHPLGRKISQFAQFGVRWHAKLQPGRDQLQPEKRQ